MTPQLRFFAAAGLLLIVLSGCNGESNCISQHSVYCDERIAYWVNSCGDIEGVKEQCQFGCNSDQTGCEPPECLNDQDCIQLHGPGWHCELTVKRCAQDSCTPDCTGKCCGPDGCGGVCPDSCMSPESCNVHTCRCESSCTPDCVGKCCGPDGCGGQCPNNCVAGMACEAASCSCVNVCTPDCRDKECGPDGCGGVCGTCPNGQFCDKGMCTEFCGPSTCPNGCCSSTTCQPGNSDQACGTGGVACRACTGGQKCISGVCGIPEDPCDGITAEGHCLTPYIVEYCYTPPDGSPPYLEQEYCDAGEVCEIVFDWAMCVPEFECYDGETDCADATSIYICIDGYWEWQPCDGECIESPLGDYCAPVQQFETRYFNISYQTRGPNQSLTGWGDVFRAEAKGFYVRSADISTNPDTTYDWQVTDMNGDVWIQVPVHPGPNDYLVIHAAGVHSNGDLAFVVADPDLSRGTWAPGTTGTDPGVWHWKGKLQDLTSASVHIPEESFSGAARVFDYLRYAYSQADQRWPGQSREPVVVWLGSGVEWDCGSCFGAWPEYHFGTLFQSQIFIGGGQDETYWSDAVTGHELGHWVMNTFGTSPREYGSYCLGYTTLPGQAWSEGWANWFSADLRDDHNYYDKQDGVFFWFSIETRQYSQGYPWVRPEPWWGLFQEMDANEVSAMLWGLSSVQGLENDEIDQALASYRLNAGWTGRGYYRHTWEVVNRCDRVNVMQTNEVVPMVADFFDALMCDGMSAWRIDEVTKPTVHYPYPSYSPICYRVKAPVTAEWRVLDGKPEAGGLLTLELAVSTQGDWPVPIEMELVLPEGVELVRGPKRHILPARFDPDVGQFEYQIRLNRVPEQDVLVVLDSRIPGMGLHAEIPYRFGRPAPTAPKTDRMVLPSD